MEAYVASALHSSSLDHNYFTGEKGVRIDYLSYHTEGDGLSKNIINGEIEIINEIKKKYPSLSNKPFFNDEADPLVGWSKDEEWRADATYASMVTKVIGQHQNFSTNHPLLCGTINNQS
jgi:L-iduronidase